MLHKVEIDLFGTLLSIESGVMAKQADGSVIVRSGDNVVLVTACCSGKPRAGASFFPLTVDYREGTYAAGKFPGVGDYRPGTKGPFGRYKVTELNGQPWERAA